MDRNIVNLNSDNSHKCYGKREGNWIVFRCPICEGYERRINIITGDMKSTYSEDDPPHNAFYMKPGIDDFSMSNN